MQKKGGAGGTGTDAGVPDAVLAAESGTGTVLL